jgi:hypothetical protein
MLIIRAHFKRAAQEDMKGRNGRQQIKLIVYGGVIMKYHGCA